MTPSPPCCGRWRFAWHVPVRILKYPRARTYLVSFQPLAQSLCSSGDSSYLHRSFASQCPNSSPGSASEVKCGSPGQSSLSRNLPRCGGWPWAEAGASLRGGTSPPALWGRGRSRQSPGAGLPLLDPTAWSLPVTYCLRHSLRLGFPATPLRWLWSARATATSECLGG